MRCPRSVLLLVLLLSPAAAAGAPVDEVKESFRAYKTAVLAADGKAAAEVVTQDSHAYFRKLADQALTLDRAGLHSIGLTERIYTLLLRHTLARDRLERMSGEDVVTHAVDEGWIGGEGARRLELGNYQVEGGTATGTILHPDGAETPFRMAFVKEEGRWLLDLVALMDLTREAFDHAVQQSGMSEDDFVMLMLEEGTGRKPGPEIWNPPS